METKEMKIEVPQGYEIDKEKSTFEKIVFKKVVNANLKFESSIPFNLDGEKHDFGGDVTVSVHRPKVEVFVGKSKDYTRKKTKKKR